jgi:hypothetical protein
MRSMYVQFGCGWNAPEAWTNFDASLTLKWERTPLVGRLYTKNSQRFPSNVRWGDIVRGLPIASESCRGIYASHVLEHLALDDFHKALDNTRTYLVPGGIFRLVVPSLEWAAKEYVRRLESGQANANAFFLQETRLGSQAGVRNPLAFVHRWLNTSSHLWMWDHLSITQALEFHGFKRVRPCQFGDCEDSMFALVEDRSRFENAVCVESVR